MNSIFAILPASRQAPILSGSGAIKKLITFGACTLLAGCAVIPKGGVGSGSGSVTDPNNIVANDSDRHRVALLLPVSGVDAEVGESIANATMLALLDTKDTKIRMTTYDTASGVASATQKAIADGNKLILGPLRGDDVVSVATLARPAHIPVISFSNDIGVAGQNVFVMGHLPNQSIDRVVKYARAMGMTKFGAIVPKNVYGQRASSTFAVSVRSAGGTMVNVQEADATTAGLDAAAKRLSKAGAVDAVLIADSGKIAIASASAIRKYGVKSAKMLGTDLWNTDATIPASTAMRGAWFASVSDGLYKQYATKYRTRFGKAPMRLSSLGYDSVLLVARVAQNWKIGSAFPVNRLLDPEGFGGIDGTFRFLPTGLSERTLEVQEVRAGQYVTVDAAPKGFAP
jgi:branched-chain amino acid transport system substrate-binding protein